MRGHNLRLGDDGIWSCEASAAVSYPEGGNEACFAVEDSSFWFGHRNQCILEAVKQFPPQGAIFDVGGGNGFVARALQDAGIDVVVVEPGPRGAANARSRGVRHVVRATLEEAGFARASLPAVGLFDVVEHIPDDLRFLENLHGYLTEQGRVYITVPACPWLWSHEDESAGHFRRYTSRSLSNLLAGAGLTVDYLTAIFDFLPLPIFCSRVLPYRLHLAGSPGESRCGGLGREHELRSPFVRRVLGWTFRRELKRIQDLRKTRFGGSLLAVGSKRQRRSSAASCCSCR